MEGDRVGRKEFRDHKKGKGIVQPPIGCFNDERWSTQKLFNNMKYSVWILRSQRLPEINMSNEEKPRDDVYYSDLMTVKLPHIYASGVCVSEDGTILTSSQVCDVVLKSFRYNNMTVTGHPFGDEQYQSLQVLHIDTKLGYAILSPSKKSPQGYMYASLTNECITSRCPVLTIAHPGSIKFSLLNGIVTHPCTFDLDKLDDSLAIANNKTYVSVKDVLYPKLNVLLDKSLGLELQLKESMHCPLLTIQNIYHCNGVSGGPIFDKKGLVQGLVWFGDKTFTYALPAQCITHSLSTSRHSSQIRISINGNTPQTIPLKKDKNQGGAIHDEKAIDVKSAKVRDTGHQVEVEEKRRSKRVLWLADLTCFSNQHARLSVQSGFLQQGSKF